MAKHCDPACNKPVYKETVKVYERCAVVNCAYTEVIVTETQDKDGVVTTTLTDREGNPLPADTKFFECKDPVNAIVCQPEVPPPEPITLEGTACDGSSNPATGMPGEIVQVVQAPGQVFSVRFCSDDNSDFELSCGIDPDTGHTVQTAYKIVSGEFVLIKRWDVVTGAEWTGDPTTLESCGGSKLESDGRDVCVSGVDLTQWIVKKDGAPTGVVYYTDNNGQLVDVPAGTTVSIGKCVPSCADAPIVDCDNVIHGYAYNVASAAAAGATVPVENCDGSVFGYILPAAAPGHTKPITLDFGVGAEIIGYAADIGCATDIEQESDPVDVCIDGVSATRWQIKENGVPVGVVHYTNEKGDLIYPAADAVITLGHCAAVCNPTISSAFADDLSTLLPGTSISIQKNNCCSIKVSTSAGDFIVSKDAAGYSTGDFDCEVTVTGVAVLSGTCDLADVIVTTQKRK